MNKLAWELLNSAPTVMDPQWRYANTHRILNALNGCDRKLRELSPISLTANIAALKDSVDNGLTIVNLNTFPVEQLADIESLASESITVIPVENQGAIDYWTAVHGLALMAQGKADQS